MTATNTAVATIQHQPRSVLVDIATRYGMEPAAFEATVRATVCKGNVSREEFAAFLLVAKEYRLNPLTKEIYAFPAKGGGIQPIVSIDGWARIINERPELDGIEFDDQIVEGQLFSVTARIYRKDRRLPIVVTEYMGECRRATDVWKQWPARMLRHKALIQCARYAFGFSGIVDPDEYERLVEVQAAQGTGMRARLESRAATGGQGFSPDHVSQALDATLHDATTGEIIDAEVEEITEAAGDGFPGDKPAPDQGQPPVQEQAPVGPPRQEATEQPKLTIPERVAAFRKRMGEATNSIKLRSIRRAADNLFDDMERTDPEGRVELAFEYEERLGILEEAEKAERAKGGA